MKFSQGHMESFAFHIAIPNNAKHTNRLGAISGRKRPPWNLRPPKSGRALLYEASRGPPRFPARRSLVASRRCSLSTET